MKIEITGEPKEIAALVLAVQERQYEAVVETTDWAGNVAVVTEKNRKGRISFLLFYSTAKRN